MQDKFGLAFKDAVKIIEKHKNLNSIRFKCLSVHIGSQILSNVPYKKMIRVVNSFLEKVSVKFEYVDFGGGMGIDYGSNKKTVVNVGIRLNPNVNAQTIGKISTGRMQDKFGLAFKDANKIIDKYKYSNSITIKCLRVHIGSQI